MRTTTLAVVLLCGCFPTPPPDGLEPAPVDAAEHAQTVKALAPRHAGRPLVVVVAEPIGTETTDFLVPFGVLQRSGVAEVVAASAVKGRVQLMPALAVETSTTFAELEGRTIDYVIVPAMHDAANPAVLEWLKLQAGRGAVIAGICSGVLVVANTGLLDGRRATGHWADVDPLMKAHPTMTWVRDRRFVVDGNVATTTGITASVPFSLTLIEAIAGTQKAGEVAQELGVERWDEAHDSDAFRLKSDQIWAVLGNEVGHPGKQLVAVAAAEGVDEVALAFTADAYSRTWRSRAVAQLSAPITMRGGLTLLPEPDERPDVVLPAMRAEEPARALDDALDGVRTRYGDATARFVALQLEYPWEAK